MSRSSIKHTLIANGSKDLSPLTVITKCFRREHLTQLYHIRVLQLLPHLHQRHALGRLQAET